ncbi:MAG: glycerol-3-phosphate 1-O-acyltransferase PlsY [Bacteroidota bacterium]
MISFEFIVGVVIAYLLGSIPSAVIIGKLFYGIDVREHGSKNSGATNTFRVLGKKPGIIVLLIDVFKGYLAVFVVGYLLKSSFAEMSLPDFVWNYSIFGTQIFNYQLTHESFFPVFQISLAVSAVIGHIYPVFAGFRGGKGVATMLGILIALQPIAAIISIIVFVIVFYFSRFVSLGSLSGALLYPFVVRYVINTDSMIYIYFSFFVAILVVYTHRKNIKRLLNGEETKIVLNSVKK